MTDTTITLLCLACAAICCVYAVITSYPFMFLSMAFFLVMFAAKHEEY